jgi:peptidoglycan/LPS O-acetylase OafA/YrhL
MKRNDYDSRHTVSQEAMPVCPSIATVCPSVAVQPSIVRRSAQEFSIFTGSGNSTLTIGDRLDARRGATNGFDYLRITLAVAVIGWHSVFTSYGYGYESGVYASWVRSFVYPILPMFFVLGGFLVAGSLFRTRGFPEFFLLRVLRFLPALLVVVSLSALVAGPLLTTEALPAYFSDTKFRAYFLNIFAYFQSELPGVFADNPAPGMVNVSLWTIPWEFGCSIALFAVMFFREGLRSRALVAVTVVALITIPTTLVAFGRGPTLHMRPPGHLLALCFMAGTCFYVYRHKIPSNLYLFIGCLALSLLLFSGVRSAYFAIIPIAYVTIYLGVLDPPKYGFMKRTDLSYGIYLYGCVVQQTLVSLFPGARVWWINWIISTVLAAFCAFFSWHLIEGPIMRHKKQIIARLLGWNNAKQ